MKYHSPKQYLDEAQSAATSPDRLDVLSECDWEFVRAAVAANPNTKTSTLAGLVPSGTDVKDEGIAMALVQRRAL